MANKTTGKLKLWLTEIDDKISTTITSYLPDNFTIIDDKYSELADGVETKVDKAFGKSLIADTEIDRLSGIETEANKTVIANNLTETTTGKALDATQGKVLKDDIGDLFELETSEKSSLVEAVNSHLADIAILNFGFNNAGFHNSIYRGKFLGNQVSAAQWLEIEAGTFKDMFIGDYWTIDNIDWVICAFDYYMTTGSSYKVTDHHVTLMPRGRLYAHKMNNSATTDGGYLGSLMYEEGLDEAKITIKAAFNNRILKHEQYLTNGYGEDGITASVWVDSEVELCNEVMVFGTQAFGSHIYSSGRAVGVCKSQLPVFTLRPDFANIGADWWLRDPVSGKLFAVVLGKGLANANTASSADGVRPLFSIS